MSTEPITVVTTWIDAANKQNTECLTELSMANIEIVGPRGSGHGINLLHDWLARAGLTLESKRIFARHGTVVVEQHGVWRSVETGDFIGEADVASRFEVEKGQVKAFERFDDLQAALKASGLQESDEAKVV